MDSFKLPWYPYYSMPKTALIKAAIRDKHGLLIGVQTVNGSILDIPTVTFLIDDDVYEFFVITPEGGQVKVHTVHMADGKYISTNPNSTTGDNLDNIPLADL